MANSGRGSATLYAALVLLGMALGILLAVGGFLAWQSLRPSPPPATTATLPPPPTTLAAAPTPEPAEVTPPPETEPAAPPATVAQARRPPRPPAPQPTPGPPQPGPTAAGLLSQAEGALGEHSYEKADGLFDEALKLDPQNAKAKAGKATAAALRRTFVLGVSSAESVKEATPRRMDGFDSGDVEVKRAAEVPGKIEFEVSPTRVKPGDTYSVRLYLLNTGKKDIRIKNVNVARTVNGRRSELTVAPRALEIAPRARALLDVLPGTWPPDVTSWALDVLITSNRGDTYQNQVVWK